MREPWDILIETRQEIKMLASLFHENRKCPPSILESGLSEFHKILLCLNLKFFNHNPTVVSYRKCKHFESDKFKLDNLSRISYLRKTFQLWTI